MVCFVCCGTITETAASKGSDVCFESWRKSAPNAIMTETVSHMRMTEEVQMSPALGPESLVTVG